MSRDENFDVVLNEDEAAALIIEVEAMLNSDDPGIEKFSF